MAFTAWHLPRLRSNTARESQTVGQSLLTFQRLEGVSRLRGESMSTDHVLTIGRLADLSGVSERTIRWYESVGLLPPPPRSEAGYRVYDQQAVRRLEFVKMGRALGLPIAELRDLLGLAEESSCNDFQGELVGRIDVRAAQIEAEVASLEQKRLELQRLRDAVAAPNATCKKPDVSALDCPPWLCITPDNVVGGGGETVAKPKAKQPIPLSLACPCDHDVCPPDVCGCCTSAK
jgi:DNA-binding transcriptional MerR regulator